MTIGKHLSLAFRKHLVSLWPHLKSLLQISLWFVESQLSELSREMVFWAWTNQSMAVGPMVIWSLHATWCCWCVRGMFWIWQVHHHSNSVNGLLELSLGTGFSLLIGFRFLCVHDLVLVASLSSQTGRWRGGGGGRFPFPMNYATDIWVNMSDVYTALMKMLLRQKGRHLSCLSCLLNILTSPNNQCMETALHVRAEGNSIQTS